MHSRTLINGIIAGIVIFFAGFLIYGIVMESYFRSNMPSYPGLLKDPMEIWAIAAGNLVWGLLLAWGLSWAGAKSASKGALFSAVTFFLYSLGSSLVAYGQMNLYTLQSVFVEALCMAVMAAPAGAVIGWMLGRNPDLGTAQ